MATANSEPLGSVSASGITLNLDASHDDFELVCLGVEISDLDDDHTNEMFIKRVHSFTDIDSCLEFMTVHWSYRIFFIVSDQLVFSVLKQVEKIDHIISMFILCENPISNDLKIISSKKCRGMSHEKNSLMTNVMEDILRKNSIFSINNVCQDLEENQKSFNDPRDTLIFSLLSDINGTVRPHYEDYSQLSDKQQMLRECRLFYQNKPETLKQIEEFARDYNSTESIRWYTKDSFLFRFINAALRTQSSMIIEKIRYWLRDLEESLDLFFAKQTFDQWSSSYFSTNQLRFVYRGQLLSYPDTMKLQTFVGQSMTMSQYISTTKNMETAEMFAGNGERSPQCESVIYEIDMSVVYEDYFDKPHPSIYYHDIGRLSHINDEDEVLFRIGTVFKVMSMEKSSPTRWYVQLRLEKVDDYRSKNKINQAPTKIVQSFFRKASEKQKINVDNIISECLSSDVILRMSVFIRLGHLVKHHPREQLQYYQTALSIIPAGELVLIEVGYWAIRIRCITSVNDWTVIPLNVYRQTVLHIQGDHQRKLRHELARIDEARGAIDSAKLHYEKLLKDTDDCSDKGLILKEMERLDNKDDRLKSMVQSGESAYWHLYAGVLTTGERSFIDYQCQLFHQSIDNHHWSEEFSFADLLPGIDLDTHTRLPNEFSPNTETDSRNLSTIRIFIKSLTDKLLTLIIDLTLTIGQLKDTIRRSFEISYPRQYDFRLIHLGVTLSDQEKSINDYHIQDRSIIYLVHGPRIRIRPMTHVEQLIQENTGLNVSDMVHILAAENVRLEKAMAKQQRDGEMFSNMVRNMRQYNLTHSGPVKDLANEFFRESLALSQYDDDDADPAGVLDLPECLAEQYLQNSGPQTSIFQFMDLFSNRRYQTNVDENDTNQQFDDDDHHHRQRDEQSKSNQIDDLVSDCTLA